MKMKLDPWQKKVLETKGNICLRSGRQVGKSTIISIKAGDYALENPNKTVMIIASVERQASLLFEKILAHIYDKARYKIKTGKDRPTRHKLQLRNGSVIHCLPTGESGYGIRGFTIHLLIADEAAFVPEDVWTAVTPMLTITKGDIWLLSTPHGKEGFYYRCFNDPKYTSFHVSSEECPRRDEEFLKHEKSWMTKAQYAQEYLGEFVDELQQFFPSELIDKVCTINQRNKPTSQLGIIGDNFLGVDVARMGTDESVLLSVERLSRERIKQIDMEITTKTLLTETIRRIKNANKKHDYQKIFIDDAGVGAGVFDVLFEDEEVKRKVVGINNAKRVYERDSTGKEIKDRKKVLMKENLYNNLLFLMEKGAIELFNEPEIKLSLKSIQYEYTDDGKLKIFGNYSHITEALVRAAYCMKDKTLNISSFC